MICHPRRRRVPILVVLAMIALVLAAISAGCPRNGPGDSSGTPPSIVLVTVDALVGADLSAFGGSTATPNLAALVESGSAWRDVWTAAPLTRPAIATYLTGLAPDRHGVVDDVGTTLPATTPTLATLLSARGYATAAFPGADFLGAGSGLLRGFDVIDHPPGILYGVTTWLPRTTPLDEQIEHVKTWLGSLPPERPLFAWIHTSELLLERMQRSAAGRDLDDAGSADDEGDAGAAMPPEAAGAEDPDRDSPQGDTTGAAAAAPEDTAQRPRSALERLDEGLGALLAALEARGGDLVVVVAGTLGDPTGGENELPGPGFSLHERVVRVPVLARLSGSAAETTGEARWAPDVPVTLAALAGVELPDAEGTDLRSPAPDRVLFSWTRAPLDQMGWTALRAARRGDRKRIEDDGAREVRLGSGGSESPLDDATGDALAEALAARAQPAPPALALEVVQPVLEARGIHPEPVPAEGRRFGTPAQRLAVTESVWRGRWAMRRPAPRRTLKAFREALAVDPQNLAALLGLGQMMLARGGGDAAEPLGRAVRFYPTHPEVVHWYAHAIWRDAWREGETLVRAASTLRPSDGDLLYDLACARSLDGDVAGASDYLRRSIEAGYHEWEAMASDPDLRTLRESGRFAEVLKEYRR